MRALSRDEVREIDRRAIEEYGLSGLVLMENAGRNAAILLDSLSTGGRIAIVCGKGNNAGDGFVMARHLENLGHHVRILLAAAPQSYQGDAAANLQIVQKAGLEIVDLSTASRSVWDQELSSAGWIADALLGTGLTGEVRQPLGSVIEAINESSALIFAVDLPSGMDANTGQPLGICVRAVHTATFVARKTGFDTPGAADWTGPVSVVDIGVPRRLLDEVSAARP